MIYIFSSLIASITFLIFLFPVKSTFLIAIICGFLTFIATRLVLNRFVEHDFIENTNEHENLIEQFESKLAMFSSTANLINDEKIKLESFKLNSHAEVILENLKKDKHDLNRTKKYVHYYIDAIINIISKYVAIQSSLDNHIDKQQISKRCMDSLVYMNKYSEKLVSRLFENDIMDLDVEMKVLKRSLSSIITD